MIAFFVIVFRVDVNAFTMTYYKLYMQSKAHLTPILYCTSWVARITKADFNVHFWSRVENVYKMQIVSKCYNRYKIQSYDGTILGRYNVFSIKKLNERAKS